MSVSGQSAANPERSAFPENYQLYVPESAQVGRPVGKIKANDDDLGVNAEIKYTIINSEGANTFTISTDRDSREGVISLKKVNNNDNDDDNNNNADKQQSHCVCYSGAVIVWVGYLCF